jgi:hypothetical protein
VERVGSCCVLRQWWYTRLVYYTAAGGRYRLLRCRTQRLHSVDAGDQVRQNAFSWPGKGRGSEWPYLLSST